MSLQRLIFVWLHYSFTKLNCHFTHINWMFNKEHDVPVVKSLIMCVICVDVPLRVFSSSGFV